MIKNRSIFIVSALCLLMPYLVLATTTVPAVENVMLLNKTVNVASVNGFMQFAIAVSDWILGIVGSLSLLMFVYGGFMYLISAGESGKINTAKSAITNAVIGLVIVFGSYVFIKFILSTLKIEWNGTTEYTEYIEAKK